MMYKSQFLSISLLFSMLSISQNIHSDCDLSNVAVPVQITQENFDKEVLQAEIPVIFYAYQANGWSCRAMNPIVAELCQEFTGKIKFVTMDVAQNAALATELEVQCLPTFFLFYAGEMDEIIAGEEALVTKEEFKEMCEDWLKILAEEA